MPQTILVVEDEPNIVESLSFLMKKAGFIVRVARDGDTAIRTIESGPRGRCQGSAEMVR